MVTAFDCDANQDRQFYFLAFLDFFFFLQQAILGFFAFRFRHDRHRLSLHHWQQKQSLQGCFLGPAA